jgi:AcrR family transcriptional regulator
MARVQRQPRAAREEHVLDVAQRLFYARGVHEVGMDELVRETGLGKASVYRLFPTKDALIGAYLQRLAGRILDAIDADVQRHPGDSGAALRAIFDAVERDVASDGFRGCPFNNASIEFSDPAHPARAAAREYRQALHERLCRLAGEQTGAQLAVLIDGMYTNAAHLGASGPAASSRALFDQLVGR